MTINQFSSVFISFNRKLRMLDQIALIDVSEDQLMASINYVIKELDLDVNDAKSIYVKLNWTQGEPPMHMAAEMEIINSSDIVGNVMITGKEFKDGVLKRKLVYEKSLDLALRFTNPSSHSILSGAMRIPVLLSMALSQPPIEQVIEGETLHVKRTVVLPISPKEIILTVEMSVDDSSDDFSPGDHVEFYFSKPWPGVTPYKVYNGIANTIRGETSLEFVDNDDMKQILEPDVINDCVAIRQIKHSRGENNE